MKSPFNGVSPFGIGNPFTFRNIGGKSSPSYVAPMDGFSQYWQFSSPIEIPANTDFEIRFKVKGDKQSFEGLLDSTDGSFWLRFLSNTQTNNLQGYIESSYLSAFPFTSVNLRDGLEHELIVKRVSGSIFLGYDNVLEDTGVVSNIVINLDRIGRYSTIEFEGYIKDFKVSVAGVEEYSIPLTNKEQGATQLATVGNVNATMINYTEAVWQEV